MRSFSVKRFDEGGLAAANGDEGIDGVLPSPLEGATIADINAAAARQFASQDRMKALIDEAKARLSQQRAPSVFGALSEGLAQPKTQPGISGTLANISSGLSTYRKGKSAFDEAQAEKLLAYQLKQEELQGARATTEGTTATRLATLAAAQARADAAAADKVAKAKEPLKVGDRLIDPVSFKVLYEPVNAEPLTDGAVTAALRKKYLSGVPMTKREMEILRQGEPAWMHPAPDKPDKPAYAPPGGFGLTAEQRQQIISALAGAK